MAITAKQITDKSVWEGYIVQHPEANFLQSWQWGVAKQNLGMKVYHSGLFRNQKLVGAILSVVEPAKRGRHLTVAGGPILDWQDKEVVKAMKDELIRIAKEENCVFVRVRPQLTSSVESLKLFEENGFKPAQMHLEAELTSQLDIRPELDKLLRHMRKNTRYELKQAKKRNIKVTKTTIPNDVKAFYHLQLETAERHGFIPFSYERLYEQFKAFAEDNQVTLYSSHTDKGELIAQAFVVFYNQEASYHYGASTDLGRNEPGAYAIQWQAIKDAKEKGCTRYNFWGVVHPEDKKHRFYGVSVFKRGFRGEDVEYLHAHDLIIDKIKYLKNYAVEYTRKRVRKV